ncbi:recombinase RecT [Sulfurovum sp. XTW-4]|uniref:Recombinase RecT n=1 Tax=Sulfurovum xiamenensis TaxID=3019066 RepID=A0ABT7QUM3_9BACT|nr:recombinase RecT [Sulfurovum xiamenensis]MDM5264771.1 recombinase RecT [Sulfurovum xiamenensis]
MSALTERKQQVTAFLGSQDITNRITALFQKDDKKAEKFKATIVNIALDSSLSTCTVPSILKSALDIAELELPLAKGLGQAYIVKYKKDAQPVIGYKGWLALAERSGKSVKAKPVFTCDEFAMEDNGFDETITFKPNFDERKDYDPKWVNENLKGVLVAVRDNNSGIVSNTFVSFGKINQLAGKSPSKNSSFSPYSEWNLEMYQAKAIKYVLSKTPMSEVVGRAVEVDNQADIKRIEENKQHDGFNLNQMMQKHEETEYSGEFDAEVEETDTGESSQ